MKKFKLPQDMKTMWKQFPIRITDGSKSPCCNAPNIYVQGMKGGFVTRNCSECLTNKNVSLDMFKSLNLLVACPKCGKSMIVDVVDNNYVYVCKKCDLYIKLGDMLPDSENIK